MAQSIMRHQFKSLRSQMKLLDFDYFKTNLPNMHKGTKNTKKTSEINI